MTKKPKIRVFALFIHPHRYGKFMSGSERRFIEISGHLKHLGLDTYALEPEPSLKKAWLVADYESVTVPIRVSKEILKRLKTLLVLCFLSLRLCKKLNCDLVYATRHELFENVIPGYFVSRVLRKPLVINFNGFFTKDRLSLRALLLTRIRKKGFNPVSAVLYTFLNFAERIIYRRAEVCIAVSPTVKDEAIRFLSVRRVEVSGDGINFNKYQSVKVKDKIYDAAYLGRVHPSKGIDVLIRAWRSVVDTVPKAKLVIIGSGLEASLKHYSQMIEKLNLQDNVKITGFIWKDEEMIKLLESSKVFVFPSLEEGFGIAVAEAMACGLPCVISDIPALRKIFGEVAVLVNPKDSEKFAIEILNLLENKDKREALGKRACEYVKRFDWKEIARKEFEVFERLTASRKIF